MIHSREPDSSVGSSLTIWRGSCSGDTGLMSASAGSIRLPQVHAAASPGITSRHASRTSVERHNPQPSGSARVFVSTCWIGLDAVCIHLPLCMHMRRLLQVPARLQLGSPASHNSSPPASILEGFWMNGSAARACRSTWMKPSCAEKSAGFATLRASNPGLSLIDAGIWMVRPGSRIQ